MIRGTPRTRRGGGAGKLSSNGNDGTCTTGPVPKAAVLELDTGGVKAESVASGLAGSSSKMIELIGSHSVTGSETGHSLDQTAEDGSVAVSDDDVEAVSDDCSRSEDDLVDFMSSLGVKGAFGPAEMSLTALPPLNIVSSETRETRMQRVLFLKSLKLSDLSQPVLIEILTSDACFHMRIDYDRPVLDPNSWAGNMELYFRSADAASLALEQLTQLRPTLVVKRGSEMAESSIISTERTKFAQEEEMKPWTDLILIVKHTIVPSDDCKVKLKELFPGADVVFHKASPSDVLKGQAYLIFGNKQQLVNTVQKFKRQACRLDGSRLVLLRWNASAGLPDGMLKLGERRLVMLTMMETESKLEKFKDVPHLNEKYKALCEIIARDTKARRESGFPAPSYNVLKGLYDIRHYSDAEQSLILRRLLAPYNCAAKTVAPSKETSDTTTTEKPASAVVNPAAGEFSKPAAAISAAAKSKPLSPAVAAKPIQKTVDTKANTFVPQSVDTVKKTPNAAAVVPASASQKPQEQQQLPPKGTPSQASTDSAVKHSDDIKQAKQPSSSDVVVTELPKQFGGGSERISLQQKRKRMRGRKNNDVVLPNKKAGILGKPVVGKQTPKKAEVQRRAGAPIPLMGIDVKKKPGLLGAGPQSSSSPANQLRILPASQLRNLKSAGRGMFKPLLSKEMRLPQSARESNFRLPNPQPLLQLDSSPQAFLRNITQNLQSQKSSGRMGLLGGHPMEELTSRHGTSRLFPVPTEEPPAKVSRLGYDESTQKTYAVDFAARGHLAASGIANRSDDESRFNARDADRYLAQMNDRDTRGMDNKQWFQGRMDEGNHAQAYVDDRDRVQSYSRATIGDNKTRSLMGDYQPPTQVSYASRDRSPQPLLGRDDSYGGNRLGSAALRGQQGQTVKPLLYSGRDDDSGYHSAVQQTQYGDWPQQQQQQQQRIDSLQDLDSRYVSSSSGGIGSSRMQGAGDVRYQGRNDQLMQAVDPSQGQSGRSEDQSDTIALLVNLSQLLADKLQRERGK